MFVFVYKLIKQADNFFLYINKTWKLLDIIK